MFGPIVPLGGVGGLAFIDRTFERQFELFNKSPQLERDVSYFLENAASFDSAEALVQDTRALRVVLGSVGLEDELPKRAFIRKVLEEGTLDPDAFALKLADPSWRKLAERVGFGNGFNGFSLENARTQIAADYRTRQFERALGDVDVDLRLALNFRREVAEISRDPAVENAGWFRITGSRPLRAVVDLAFGLPEQFGALDLDLQRTRLEDVASARYGGKSPAIFTDPEVVEDVIRRFLVRSQAQAGPSADTPGFTALTILQASNGLGGLAQGNLFASNFGLR
ncbi:MAG: DUF1217 domain-containing protein [Pseudomonadota bacterium]